jgi:hypothetical protein
MLKWIDLADTGCFATRRKEGNALPQHEDVIMKSVMELFKGDAIKFFGVDDEIIAVSRMTELIQLPLTKIDDWLFEARDCFIHCEFQTTDGKEENLYRFMVADAMLAFKMRKPIRTIVVYSADIEDTMTTLDIGSIKYSLEAFYMSAMDGDSVYAGLRTKIDAGEPLTKQDLMSVVFLPLMKSSVNRVTRIEQSVELSNALTTEREQEQIQAMLLLLAEKFVTDKDTLRKIKEMIKVGVLLDMIVEDVMVEVAKNALKEGVMVDSVAKITGLDESTIRDLQAKTDSEQPVLQS